MGMVVKKNGNKGRKIGEYEFRVPSKLEVLELLREIGLNGL
jgi:hypothetical protein